MDEELGVELEKLEPDDGDIVLVRTGTELDDDELEAVMVTLGRLLAGSDVKLLYVGPYALTLDLLTDETLRNLGLERVG